MREVPTHLGSGRCYSSVSEEEDDPCRPLCRFSHFWLLISYPPERVSVSIGLLFLFFVFASIPYCYCPLDVEISKGRVDDGSVIGEKPTKQRRSGVVRYGSGGEPCNRLGHSLGYNPVLALYMSLYKYHAYAPGRNRSFPASVLVSSTSGWQDGGVCIHHPPALYLLFSSPYGPSPRHHPVGVVISVTSEAQIEPFPTPAASFSLLYSSLLELVKDLAVLC